MILENYLQICWIISHISTYSQCVWLCLKIGFPKISTVYRFRMNMIRIDFCNMPNLLDTLQSVRTSSVSLSSQPPFFRVRLKSASWSSGWTLQTMGWPSDPALPHPSDQEPLMFSACGLFMSIPFLGATWYNITAGFVRWYSYSIISLKKEMAVCPRSPYSLLSQQAQLITWASAELFDFDSSDLLRSPQAFSRVKARNLAPLFPSCFSSSISIIVPSSFNHLDLCETGATFRDPRGARWAVLEFGERRENTLRLLSAVAVAFPPQAPKHFSTKCQHEEHSLLGNTLIHFAGLDVNPFKIFEPSEHYEAHLST